MQDFIAMLKKLKNINISGAIGGAVSVCASYVLLLLPKHFIFSLLFIISYVDHLGFAKQLAAIALMPIYVLGFVLTAGALGWVLGSFLYRVYKKSRGTVTAPLQLSK
jgi:hypothetical protein